MNASRLDEIAPEMLQREKSSRFPGRQFFRALKAAWDKLRTDQSGLAHGYPGLGVEQDKIPCQIFCWDRKSGVLLRIVEVAACEKITALACRPGSGTLVVGDRAGSLHILTLLSDGSDNIQATADMAQPAGIATTDPARRSTAEPSSRYDMQTS